MSGNFEELINKFNLKNLLIQRNNDGTYNLSATIDGHGYDKETVTYDIASNGLTMDNYCIDTTNTDISSSVKHSISLGKSILAGREGVLLDMVLRE